MASLDERILDDPDELAARDSLGHLRALATAGAQVREAIARTTEAGIDRLAGEERPRSVLLAALGSSAIVPAALDALTDPASAVAVAARRGGPLPGWVGPMDVVVAISLSGNAPGPVRLAEAAGRRGALLLTVGAAGSPLADVSARYRGIHVDTGRGRVSTRTSLWSLLTPVLMAADRMDMLDAGDGVLHEVAARLDVVAEACRPSSESFINPAKVLAADLVETVPVFLGDGRLTGAAAQRGAGMMMRTTRIPATHGMLPDAASAIVATFGGPSTAIAGEGLEGSGARRRGDDIFADPFLDGPASTPLGLTLLRDAVPRPDPEAVRLAERVEAEARRCGVRVRVVEAEGVEPLERLASLVSLLDFATTYGAIGLGYDPDQAPTVAHLRD
ncbi:phosphosugar isomerase [Arsenicicoccus piscis]|uniref:SIS domain-containing protein n=1 Tax=Arsenicicoccus piscis TaxID=673954 RepID=UPI001F4CFF7F|nr:phosphosugar isomerase [Arsenicicoccus piscis]